MKMSKEEAIGNLQSIKVIRGLCSLQLNAIDMGVAALEDQKTGHWIELGYVGNDNYEFKCSECNHRDIHSKAVKVNYCWFCGARMQEVEE